MGSDYLKVKPGQNTDSTDETVTGTVKNNKL